MLSQPATNKKDKKKDCCWSSYNFELTVYIIYKFNTIVMQSKQQRNKTKTLCTIDTTDIDLQDTKAPPRLKTQTNKSNHKYA